MPKYLAEGLSSPMEKLHFLQFVRSVYTICLKWDYRHVYSSYIIYVYVQSCCNYENKQPKKKTQKKSTIKTNYFSNCQEEHANKLHIGETEGRTQKNNLSQRTVYMNSHFYSDSPNICNAVYNLHTSYLPKNKFLVLLDCYNQKVSKERY